MIFFVSNCNKLQSSNQIGGCIVCDEIKLDASGTFEFLLNSLRVKHVFKDSHLDEFKVSYIRNMLKISTNLLL